MPAIRHPAAAAFAGLAALAVAMGIGRFAFTPILPMMQQDAGLSIAAGGWLAAANYAGYLAGALTVARVRIGAAAAIRGSLLAIGCTTLAMPFGDGLFAWMLLRFVAGIASAWVLVCVSAWSIERFAPLGRPLLGATVFAGVGTGIAIAGLLCLALTRARHSSDEAWELLGALTLVVAAIVWPAFPAAPPAAVPENAAGAQGGRPAQWRTLVACYGVFGFGYIIPATFLPVMAREAMPDPAVFGWSWPVFGTAAALSTVAAAAWAGARAPRRVWIAGVLLMAVGVALPLVAHGMAAILAAALCVGGTFMVVTMAGMQEARRVAGPGARKLMAAMTAAFALGQIAGPLLVSAASALRIGFSATLALAAALLATSAWILSIKEKTG